MLLTVNGFGLQKQVCVVTREEGLLLPFELFCGAPKKKISARVVTLYKKYICHVTVNYQKPAHFASHFLSQK